MQHKFAVMDIGSNTVRLVLFETNDYIYFKTIQTFRHRLRLRSYVDDKAITEEGIKKLKEVLTYFKASLSLTDIEKVYAFATATIRDASNGEAILKQMKKDLAFDIKILSAKNEAYYGFLTVTNSTFVVDGISVDMGGGSTEIVEFTNRAFGKFVSLPFGSLSLSLEYFKFDKSGFQVNSNYVEFLQNVLKKEGWLENLRKPIVAMGGSARSLAKIHMSLKEYPLPFVHQYEMSYEDLEELCNIITKNPVKDLLKLPGLTEERLETLLPSIGFFKELMAYCNSTSFIISSDGIREGFCYSLMENEYGGMIPNIIEESIQSLATQYQLQLKEDMYELQMYYSLCKQMEGILNKKIPHQIIKMGSNALRLYNLGSYVSDENSLNHTYYILTNTSLNGFTHKEQIELALLASFKSKQKMLHYVPVLQSFFTKDEWKDIVIVGSIIRFIKEVTVKYPNVIEEMQLRKDKEHFELICTTQNHLLHTENEVIKSTKALEKLLKSKVYLKFVK